MNRQERRTKLKNEPKKSKLKRWIKTLNYEQRNLINEYAQIQNEQKFNSLEKCLDICFSASTILHSDLSLKKINAIFNNIAELMIDERMKDNEIRKYTKTQEGYDEFMKNENKKIEVDIEKMLKEGKTQKDIRAKLTVDYPLLSKSKIINAVKRMKEVFDEEKETEIAAAKIVNIIEPEEEIAPVMPEVVIEEEKEVVNADIKSKKSNLKIKNVKMEIEGLYGSYVLEDGFVELIEAGKKFNRETWGAFNEEVKEVLSLGGKNE